MGILEEIRDSLARIEVVLTHPVMVVDSTSIPEAHKAGEVVETLCPPMSEAQALGGEFKPAGPGVGMNYQAMTRDELLAVCAARQIELPKNVRTASLVKILAEYDAKARESAAAPAPVNPPAPAPSPEPAAPPAADQAVDPFTGEPIVQEPAPAEKPKEPPKKEDVIAVLQKVQAADKGNAGVIAILKTVGNGATSLSQLKESDYQAVIDVAELRLKG